MYNAEIETKLPKYYVVNTKSRGSEPYRTETIYYDVKSNLRKCFTTFGRVRTNIFTIHQFIIIIIIIMSVSIRKFI